MKVLVTVANIDNTLVQIIFAFRRRMLRLHEEEDHRRWIRVHLVVRHWRTAIIAGSDDFEPGVWERGNGAGSTANGHRSGTMQNHESRWIVAHCQWTVSREERSRDQIYNSVYFRGSSSSYTGYLFFIIGRYAATFFLETIFRLKRDSQLASFY